MITQCVCSSNVDAKLDVESGKVICQSCGKEIEMSDFMKNTLRQQGDVVRKGRDTRIPEGGMKVTCKNEKCNKEYSAILKKKDNEVYCPYCGTKAELSAFSMGLLRENGIYEDSDKVLEIEGKVEVKSEPEEL